jgi:hypothetical protein
MHRWQHSNKWLWRIHEAHHSPKKVDWLSGSRSHALEILINQTVEFLPIVLLGAPVEVIAYKGVISAVWGMYIHSNLDVKTGKLQKIINGPEMHRWHHSTGKGRNRNFATKLAIWDWIWGTAYLPETKPDEYGLKTYFPAHYLSQTLFAFRSFKQKKLKLISEIRKDVKIIVNDVLLNITNLSEFFLPLDILSNTLQKDNITAISKAIREEQAIIIFPAGEVARMSPRGIEDSKWNKGAVYFAEKYNAPVLPVYLEAKNSFLFYFVSFLNKKFSTFF